MTRNDITNFCTLFIMLFIEPLYPGQLVNCSWPTRFSVRREHLSSRQPDIVTVVIINESFVEHHRHDVSFIVTGRFTSLAWWSGCDLESQKQNSRVRVINHCWGFTAWYWPCTMMLNDSLLEACSQEWHDLESSRLCPSLAHSDLKRRRGGNIRPMLLRWCYR